MTALSVLALTIVNRKMLEYKLSKQQQLISLQQQKVELDKNKALAEAYQARQKEYLQAKKSAVTAKEKLLTEAKTTLEKLKQEGATQAEIQAQETKVAQAQADFDLAKAELAEEEARAEAAEYTLSTYKDQNALLQSQSGLLGQLTSGLSGMMTPLFMIISAYKTISGLISLVGRKSSAEHKKRMSEGLAENALNATKASGQIISQLGV